MLGQIENAPVGQLDGGGRQRRDARNRLKRRRQRRKRTHSQRAIARQRRQLQLQRSAQRQGALRAHQQPGQILSLGRRQKRVQAEAAAHAGQRALRRPDLGLAALADLQQVENQVARLLGQTLGVEMGRQFGETDVAAVGEHGVDGDHGVAHSAMAQAAQPRGVDARHAADGGEIGMRRSRPETRGHGAAARR